MVAEKELMAVVAAVRESISTWARGSMAGPGRVDGKDITEGSVTVRASVAPGPSTALRVEVQDTGLGMSPEAQVRLFEKFYRVATPETAGIQGTGLGLYITKQLVEKMGGSISVQSQEGQGSTFAVTLPAAEGAAAGA
jgi:signal transduction histidine kinase